MIETLKDKGKLIATSVGLAGLAYLFWWSFGDYAFYVFTAVVVIAFFVSRFDKKPQSKKQE